MVHRLTAILALALLGACFFLVADAPVTTAMSIVGSVECVENTTAVIPGNVTTFQLNVSVASQGIGEEIQGIRVDLSVDSGALSANLSESRLRFGTHGGYANVELTVQVGEHELFGQRNIEITGIARPMTGPVPGIRTFSLTPASCKVNVTRIRGIDLVIEERYAEIFLNGTAVLNATCRNLGNAYEEAALAVVLPGDVDFLEVGAPENTINIMPFSDRVVEIEVSATMDATVGKLDISVCLSVTEDPEEFYSKKAKVRIDVREPPAPPLTPFEPAGSPLELEGNSRDIDISIYSHFMEIGMDSTGVRISGRAGGGTLSSVRLYIVLHTGNSSGEGWLWFSVPVTEHSRRWSRWECDTTVTGRQSLLSEVLGNLSITEQVHFVAVGLDSQEAFDIDVKSRALTDIPALVEETPGNVKDPESANSSGGIVVPVVITGIIALMLLLLIVVISRSIG